MNRLLKTVLRPLYSKLTRLPGVRRAIVRVAAMTRRLLIEFYSQVETDCSETRRSGFVVTEFGGV